MSSLATEPKRLKGAIVGMGPSDATPSVIIFQYDPATLSRSLRPHTVGGETEGLSPLHFTGERITLVVEIAALSTGATVRDDVEGRDGVSQQLSQLERLLHPPALADGVPETVPYDAPLTVLALGPRRVQPIKLLNYAIIEQSFAPDLTPLRATVSLEVEVLTYRESRPPDTGFHLYLANLQFRELLATLGSASPPP